MERAKAAQKIAHHLQEREELFETRARPFEKDLVIQV
jgi:hypothetical protein